MVIISLDVIRAVVLHDRVYLSLPDGADEFIEVFMKKLQECSAAKSEHPDQDSSSIISFELNVYESILSTSIILYSHEYKRLSESTKQMVNNALVDISFFLSSELQLEKQSLLDRINTNILCIQSIIRVLTQLLDNTEDMAMMSLSKLKRNPNLYKY